MPPLLNNLQVILVRAENPANIGQAARAMKNFGLSRLALVNCAPHQTDDAYTLGWKAKNILDKAELFSSLETATQPIDLAVGFTTRSGRKRGEPRAVNEIVPQIMEAMNDQQVALVFGNEKNGLSNEELERCDLHAVIPTAPDYSSLNLSHAITVAAFSIFTQTSAAKKLLRKPERFYATSQEFDELMRHFREALLALDYQNSRKIGLLDRTLENLTHFFRKSGLEKRELHLFRAFLSKVREREQVFREV